MSTPPRDLLALAEARLFGGLAGRSSTLPVGANVEDLKLVRDELDRLRASLAHAGGDWMAGYERGKADAANLVMNRDDAPWAVISDHVLIQIGAAIMKLAAAPATLGGDAPCPACRGTGLCKRGDGWSCIACNGSGKDCTKPTPSVEAAHDAATVERVARALFNYGRKKKSSLRWENVEPSYRKWAFDQARAALAAIAPEVRG